MKTGVIDVGGGLRGIYAVGVFDYCMDHDREYDDGKRVLDFLPTTK